MIKFILRDCDGEKLRLDVALEMKLGELIEKARDFLKDEKITPKNFGVGKHFYFVNRSTGTLIDGHVPTHLRLDSLAFLPGHEIELFLGCSNWRACPVAGGAAEVSRHPRACTASRLFASTSHLLS